MHVLYTSRVKITGIEAVWYHTNGDHALLPCARNSAWFPVILNDFHCLFDWREKILRGMIAYAYTAHSILP